MPNWTENTVEIEFSDESQFNKFLINICAEKVRNMS